MGLDMYLYKKTYVKNWDHEKDLSQKNSVNVRKGGKLIKHIQKKRISGVTEEVGYWRKANHIHKWFVDNCQDGEDDCRPVWVSEDKLQNLYETVCEVLANRDNEE